jgi:hypothetical protein
MTSICRCAFQALAWGLRSVRKQIGVWSKLPPALRPKAKDAQRHVGGLKLTQMDDSVSDDVWEIIATELSARWSYAAKPVEHGAVPVAALG